ncbi:MAG TPA: hypothetical protein VNU66_01440 [Mycobacteriales bacterium]|nr:hypothetical protein [Mycobacteriales bacterium]
MKLRTATAVLGLVVATGGAAAGSTAGTAPVQTTERVQKAIQCVTEGADPRCVSQNYALSLDRGTNSTGTALTITPAGMAVEPAAQVFSPDATLLPSYVLVGGSKIVGQVTLRQTGSASTPVGALSTVKVALSAVRVDNKKFVPLGSVEISKPVVATAADAVYKYEFTVPANLDGVAVRGLSAEVSNKQVSAGYGYLDGQGGSFFDLPHYEPAPTTTG